MPMSFLKAASRIQRESMFGLGNISFPSIFTAKLPSLFLGAGRGGEEEGQILAVGCPASPASVSWSSCMSSQATPS